MKIVTKAQNKLLSKPFALEEIQITAEGCCGEKTLGPNDITMELIMKGWQFMKEDVQKMLDGFYWQGNLDWRLNTTYLAPIPKKRDASRVSDFRPII